MIKILLLIILCHILDDFVLQLECLSNMKQKRWWTSREWYKDIYKNDYKVALAVHSMSWSIMTLLPIILLSTASEMAIMGIFIINAIIHYIVDDLKANKGKINLVVDQSIHFVQILIVWSLALFS